MDDAGLRRAVDGLPPEPRIARQGSHRAGVQWHHAMLAELGVSHYQQLAPGVEVLVINADRLPDPDTADRQQARAGSGEWPPQPGPQRGRRLDERADFGRGVQIRRGPAHPGTEQACRDDLRRGIQAVQAGGEAEHHGQSTVRGWLRRLRSRAGDMRQDAMYWLGRIGGSDPALPAPSGSPLVTRSAPPPRARMPRSPGTASRLRTGGRCRAGSAWPAASRLHPAAEPTRQPGHPSCPRPGRDAHHDHHGDICATHRDIVSITPPP